MFGSSPRAWGSFAQLNELARLIRFIPTCVGFIVWSFILIRGFAVHPHVRGVHGVTGPSVARIAGSSPRAWGSFDEVDDREDFLRFIPTCVGFILRRYTCTSRSSVHPHVRGVHAQKILPQVHPYRFIPTCVGFILLPFALLLQIPVHPHVRGVHDSINALQTGVSGSSPRAWGSYLRDIRETPFFNGISQIIHSKLRGCQARSIIPSP